MRNNNLDGALYSLLTTLPPKKSGDHSGKIAE